MNTGRTLPATLGELLATARAGLADPREAPILVAHALALEHSVLYAHPERQISPEEAGKALALVVRRAKGEPVAYLTGKREFYGLPLTVSPAVLIPRPETELLVELSLDRLTDTRDPCVADLGTGSGAIALALAHERTDARVIASDRSADALAITAANADALGLANVHLVQADWLTPFAPTAFDLIVTNPPYVAADDPHLMHGDLLHEPRTALGAGDDGLDDIRRLLCAAAMHLRPGGWIVLEHGATQQAAVIELAQVAGWENVSGYCDYSNLPRAVTARRGR
ncbi:MAG: peptide chain release factor N(5)-glutamine methyltransferase [Gammaproteobacteria bacterium]